MKQIILCERTRVYSLSGTVDADDAINILYCAECEVSYTVTALCGVDEINAEEWDHRVREFRKAVEDEHQLRHPTDSFSHDGQLRRKIWRPQRWWGNWISSIALLGIFFALFLCRYSAL